MTASEPEATSVSPATSESGKASPDGRTAPTSMDGMSHPVEGQDGSQVPASRRLKITRGTRVIVLGAVASATAGALITPALFAGLWDSISGHVNTPPASIPPSPTPVIELTRKSNRSGSISLEVPKGWAIGNADHDSFGDVTPGDAASAGTYPEGPPSSSISRIWVGASRADLKRLTKTNPEPDVAARLELEKLDWRIDGCQLALVTTFPGEVLRGPMRKWVGCDGLDDEAKWEAWTLTADGLALVVVQFDLRTNDLDEKTALQILESITVDPSRLSG